MIAKNRDSKFIIYQVLYIFVIAVLALKGADLNLHRVVSTDEAIDKSVRDSLVTLIDSLYAQGVKFDIKLDTNAVFENRELREKLVSISKKMEVLNQQIRELPPPKEEQEIVKKEEKVPEMTKLQSPISITQSFIQNTWNTTKNSGNVPVQIIDPGNGSVITTIPAGSEKRFDLADQKEVIVKFGSQTERVKVVPNRPPEVKIDLATTKMTGTDIYVQDLQRVTVFNVTILDERPGQLKVSYSGPISVTGPVTNSKGNLVYNVSLKLASNSDRFDEWLDKHGDAAETNGRYKTTFFFTIIDERTKDKVQVGDAFYFTDFNR
ncbi:MAG: hypothetical protein AUK34_00145 [Ignavibacteria bacterium CG2_30_36_16]|nr:MAG: hypothetical protein AUK34_00145 [Ignavibacteria bacterium CG2_30_36_16]